MAVDSPNAAWLNYRVVETNGSTNLTVDAGSVAFWFAPNWAGTNAGGMGPGQWGRLLEVGTYTTNASVGWWSLYLNDTGTELYFSSQTNDGFGQTHLSAPMAWTTNRWHLLALTYSPTNSALYLDGVIVTNGLPVTHLPPHEVLTNGFFIGSDGTGTQQARGLFDDLSTYDFELTAEEVSGLFEGESFLYFLNVLNLANWSSAPSTPVLEPVFVAITGAGYLQSVSNAVNCITNSSVWLTNLTATAGSGTNANVTFTFAIAGGASNAFYDVFAAGGLVGTNLTNSAWLWMGQGQSCRVYAITNLPPSAYVMLGTPQNSDADGLTDAYEKLVSRTDPLNADTDYDGTMDGWEIVYGLNPFNAQDGVPVRLGQWTFELLSQNQSGTWLGTANQAPLLSSNVSFGDGILFGNKAARFPGGSAALLAYRDGETNGAANINLCCGSVRFWFRRAVVGGWHER